MTFALPPLHLPATKRFAVEPQAAAPAQPTPEPVQAAAALDETSRPVSATFRDLTIPDLLPPQRASWRRPRSVRGRAS
jgi:hypothetical protein